MELPRSPRPCSGACIPQGGLPEGINRLAHVHYTATKPLLCSPVCGNQATRQRTAPDALGQVVCGLGTLACVVLAQCVDFTDDGILFRVVQPGLEHRLFQLWQPHESADPGCTQVDGDVLRSLDSGLLQGNPRGRWNTQSENHARGSSSACRTRWPTGVLWKSSYALLGTCHPSTGPKGVLRQPDHAASARATQPKRQSEGIRARRRRQTLGDVEYGSLLSQIASGSPARRRSRKPPCISHRIRHTEGLRASCFAHAGFQGVSENRSHARGERGQWSGDVGRMGRMAGSSTVWRQWLPTVPPSGDGGYRR